MKLTFVQKQPFCYFGVMSISGFLKKHGYNSDVVITNLERNYIQALKKTQPDIIGFSVLSTEHKWLKKIVPEVCSQFPDAFIIVGGIHSILYPEDVINIKGVNAICNSDGEIPVLYLIKSLEAGDIDYSVKGLWFNKNNKVIRNDKEYLFSDLNSYFDDREIYYNTYTKFKDDKLKYFMSSRGCPYKCSFCQNINLFEIFKGYGTYIRQKEAEHFIEEIKGVKTKYAFTSVFFADDLFSMNKKWLGRFVKLYNKEINIPFECTIRADLIDEDLVQILLEGDCHTVSFGIETGSEKLRREILNKNITDVQLINAARLLKQYGIRVQTSNMVGLPKETVENAFETIELNIKIKSDFTFVSLFTPFPRTKIAEYMIQENLLKKDYSLEDLKESFFVDTPVRSKEMYKLKNIHHVFFLAVKYPRLKRVFKKIIHLKCGWFFFILLLLSLVLRYKSERNLSYFETFKLIWRYRKSY